MSFKTWEYDITNYSISEIRRLSEEEERSEVITCDPKGQCFYNDMEQAELAKVIHLLNQKGLDGWELMQLTSHKEWIHCLWRRENPNSDQKKEKG